LTEKELQKSCELYLQQKKIKYVHIENTAGNRFKTRNTRQFKGLPDLLIFCKNSCIFVELKKDEKLKLSDEQEKWKVDIENIGTNFYKHFLVYNLEMFIKTINLYND
jgi:hypothetical protein